MALLSGLPIMVMDSIYQVASTRVGQHAISFIDRLLCIVEALNFFSAPQEQQQAARHESKELTDYKRPLPWLLFLPLLCYCRVVRVMLSIILYPFNKEISAITAVYYIQKMRRDLRYIKIQGARRMADPEQKISSLPWPLQLALSVFTWGPLQFFTIVGRLVFGDKQYNVYSTTGQPRSKRSLKKLKVADHNDCTTSELLDKFADDDDNDLANDPDFEVGATDLVTETEEEEEDVDEEENSEPEEDTVRNGSFKKGEGQEQEQNQVDNHQENTSDGQPEENRHEEHHQEEHHHY